MTVQFSGGCQCGAVRFRVEGKPGRASICHCRMCQKAFGSFGAPLVSVPQDRVTWTRGTPGEFRSSAIVARGFCADCGTPLFMREDGDPTYELAMGAFDEPNALPRLAHQTGIESRVDWITGLDQLETQETTDYRTPADMLRLKSLQHPDHDTLQWPPEGEP